MKNWKLFLLLVGLVGMGTGCGFEDAAESYKGVWNYNSGSSIVLNCSDGSSGGLPLEGNFQILGGSEHDLLITSLLLPDCNWGFNVNGDTASIASGQSCTRDGATEAWANLTFTQNGESMSVSGNGTYSGDSGSCTLTLSTSLTRIGG